MKDTGEKLKACPFCGGPARLQIGPNGEPHLHRVICCRCAVTRGWFDIKDSAIFEWNRRTPTEDASGVERSLCEYRYYTPDSIIQRCKHPESYGWKCCEKVCEKLPNHIDKLECVNCPQPNCEDRARGCNFKPTAQEDMPIVILPQEDEGEKKHHWPCDLTIKDLRAALAERRSAEEEDFRTEKILALENTITDLQVNLAEKDKRIETLGDNNSQLRQQVRDLKSLNKELRDAQTNL